MVDVTEAVKRAREHKEGTPALPTLDEVVTAYVAEVVELHDGNIAAAARTLGVARETAKRALDRARSRR